MLTRSLIIFGSFIALVCVGVGAYAYRIQPGDHMRFTRMVRAQEETTQPLVHLEKQGVIKEAHFSDGNTTKLTSHSSTLRIIPIGDEFELIENMKNIRGVVEEPDGTRTFQARTGTYYYNTHQFVSNLVTMQLANNEEVMMEGIAKHMRISFRDGQTRVEADQLRAHIPDVGSIR